MTDKHATLKQLMANERPPKSPAQLDDKILAHARAKVQSSPARKPFYLQWGAMLATASIAGIALFLVIQQPPATVKPSLLRSASVQQGGTEPSALPSHAMESLSAKAAAPVFDQAEEYVAVKKAGEKMPARQLSAAAVAPLSDLQQPVIFRARGNQPSWQLEIGDNTLLVIDNGLQQYRFETRSPIIDASQSIRRYQLENKQHQLSVFITAERCKAAVGGQPTGQRVRVLFDEQWLEGCSH